MVLLPSSAAATAKAKAWVAQQLQTDSYTTNQSTGSRAARLSAETVEHVGTRCHEQKRTRQPLPRTKRKTTSWIVAHRVDNKEHPENCGEPLLWFGALAMSDTHPRDLARTFRQRAQTTQIPIPSPREEAPGVPISHDDARECKVTEWKRNASKV